MEKDQLIKKLNEIDRQIKIIEAVKNPNVDDSRSAPIPMSTRLATQYGNPEGNIKRLREQGYLPRYIKGELHVKGPKGKYYPVDKSGLEPMDIAEFALDPSQSFQALGEGVGYSYGGIPGGMIGSGVGTFLGSKTSKAIGKMTGNYDDKAGSPNKEALKDAVISAAITGGLPVSLATLKKGGNKIGEAIEILKIPQRLYSAATGITDEEAINQLIKEKVSGGSKKLADLATKMREMLGSQKSEMLSGKTLPINSVLPDEQSFVTDNSMKQALGNINQSANASQAILEDAKKVFEANKIVNKVSTPNPNYKNVDIPDDAILKNAYKKIYPRNKINLPMRIYKDIRTPPTLREFKEIVENNKKLKSQIADEAANFDEGFDDVVKSYYDEVFRGKPTVTKVYPLPEGNMKAPKYKDWKNEELQKFVNKNSGNKNIITQQESVPLELIDKQKTELAKSARSLYESPDKTGVPKAKAQKRMADSFRAKIEEILPEIRPVNKRYYAYDELGDSLESRGKKLVKQNILPTMNDIIMAGSAAAPAAMIGGGPAGAAAGGATILTKTLLKTTSGGTKAALATKGAEDFLKGLNPKKVNSIVRILSQMAAQGNLSENGPNGQKINQEKQNQFDRDLLMKAMKGKM